MSKRDKPYFSSASDYVHNIQTTELLWYRIGVMEKITANMRQLTIATQELGARLREPGKTLIFSLFLFFAAVD